MPLNGPGTAEAFSPRAAVCDEEGIDCVTLTHCSVSVDVAVGDFGAGAARRLRVRGPVVTVDPIVERIRRGHLDPTVTFSIVDNRADVVTDVASCGGEESKQLSLHRSTIKNKNTEFKFKTCCDASFKKCH